MFWEAKQKEYDNDDNKLIGKILRELELKGDRYDRKASKDGRYIRHIFGLKSWLSKNWEVVERFIFAVCRLYSKYHDQRRELARLKEKTSAIFKTSDIVDLKDSWDIERILGREVDGIVVAKKDLETLEKLICNASKLYRNIGFKEGSNILVRMASGDLSLTEFESLKNEQCV